MAFRCSHLLNLLFTIKRFGAFIEREDHLPIGMQYYPRDTFTVISFLRNASSALVLYLEYFIVHERLIALCHKLSSLLKQWSVWTRFDQSVLESF